MVREPDEAQHLLAADAGRKPTAQLDWLKALTNRTNVLHVLVGNFDLYECCHLNGQAVRRMRDQHFPRYHLDTQTECEEFVGALRSLLECIPLTVDVSTLLTHWRWFGEWSVGCVGILGDWIVETVDALWGEGETTLTIEALARHALQPDQRARLKMEARTGENRVARAQAKSEQELLKFLSPLTHDGKPTQTSTGVGEHAHRERKGSRIKRAAGRDPVGDQMPAPSASKCSFSGVLKILPQRFLESGIERVECPDCQALRLVVPRNGVLRYPTHDKRKTQSSDPRTGISGHTGRILCRTSLLESRAGMEKYLE